MTAAARMKRSIGGFIEGKNLKIGRVPSDGAASRRSGAVRRFDSLPTSTKSTPIIPQESPQSPAI